MKIADASVAVKWVVPEADSDHAARLFVEWTRAGERVVGPPLLRYEVTNILRQKMRREGRSLSFVQAALADFVALPIRLLPAPARLHRDALDIATRFDLPATYDAHYIALAALLDCEGWTADQRLLNQVRGRLPFVRDLVEFDTA